MFKPVIRDRSFRVMFCNAGGRPVFSKVVNAATSDIAAARAERELPSGIVYTKTSVFPINNLEAV